MPPHVWHALGMEPINCNVDHLIHRINNDQREADLLAEYQAQRAERLARERDRWSDYR